MPFTIRGFLEKNGCALENSIYADCDPSVLDFQIYSGDFYEMAEDGGKECMRFKNAVNMMGFDRLMEYLPGLDKIRLPKRALFPYGAENLESFAAELRADPASAAVEGGPCLFSEHEVIAEVTDRYGKKKYFDYSEGRAYAGARIGPGGELKPSADAEPELQPAPEAWTLEEENSFAAYVRTHIHEITDIRFHCFKTGISPQEYLHLRMPFEVASALGIRLVVTLPDMSYRKYLAGALEEAEPEFRARILREFDEILCRVTDQFLDLIGKLREGFRVPDLKVLHGRDEALLKKYYEGRAPFIERNKVLRSLTGTPEKKESIKDYISMPALPYYLDGATNILEVNSAVETDSFRKCMRAHRSTLKFACILFPELLSGDGVHTMYYALPEYKQYGEYPLDFSKERTGE